MGKVNDCHLPGEQWSVSENYSENSTQDSLRFPGEERNESKSINLYEKNF